MDDDAREFVARMPGLRRLVILHVLHAPGDPAALPEREAQWKRQLADGHRTLIVQTMPLDEGWPADQLEKSWGGRLAERILLHSTWAWFPSYGKTYKQQSSSLHAQLDDGDFLPFNEAVEEWIKRESRVLHVLDDVELGIFVQAFSALELPEVVCPPAHSEKPLDLAESTRFPLDTSPDSESATSLVPLVNRLVSQREIIPFVYLRRDAQPNSEEQAVPERWGPISSLLKDRGRAIVVARESFTIPPDISRTTLKLSAPLSPSA
jgi:hypothetical protein